MIIRCVQALMIINVYKCDPQSSKNLYLQTVYENRVIQIFKKFPFKISKI